MTGPPTTPAPGTGLLVVVSGPSGVGKTTITHALVDHVGAEFSVSWTTRPRTHADKPGTDYVFVEETEFVAGIERGEFLEHAHVHGHRYGTPHAAVDTALDEGRIIVLEIDVQGAVQIRGARPDAFMIFILPPDEETLLQRLRDRKREPEEVIRVRYDAARREIAMAHDTGIYDAFVVNDRLDRAIPEVVRLVEEARAART